MTTEQPTVAYLRTLAGEQPNNGYFDVRCYHRGPGAGAMRRTMIPASQPARASRTVLRRARTADVYIGVALRATPDFGGASAIERSHLAFVELDTADAAARLAGFRHQPSMLVSSGSPGHLHAYYRLSQPVPNAQLEAINRKLADHLGGDLASVDAARILRPPGTFNRKRSPARPVLLLTHDPALTYHPDELVDGLSDPQPRLGHRRGERTWRPVSQLDGRLRAIPTAEYVRALAGLEPDRSGKVRCPFHHPDDTPSLQLYDGGTWYCFGCRQGGSVYQFAALLWDIPSRPGGQPQLRRTLAGALAIDPRARS